MSTPEEIIDFWLNDVGENNWYIQNDEIDALIKERYLDVRNKAKNGDLDDWLDSAQGSLALLILLDQFSRNLFRGDAESFAADEIARSISVHAINEGYDMEIQPPLRQFIFMPFCHSEDISDHEYLLFIADEKGLQNSLIDFQVHHEIIERFGHFPYRNEALGRKSTKEELDFIKNGGYATLRKKYMDKKS